MPVPSGYCDLDLSRTVKAISSHEAIHIHLVEEILPHDPPSQSVSCCMAVQVEVRGLFPRGLFEVVTGNLVPDTANVISGRFIRAIKNAGTAKADCKARFVVQGHHDQENQRFVHDSTTLRPQSLGVMLSIAAAYGLEVWYIDMTQAYVQGKGLSRNVYLRPEPTFGMAKDKLLKIVRPLYGLSDAGDAWWSTIR